MEDGTEIMTLLTLCMEDGRLSQIQKSVQCVGLRIGKVMSGEVVSVWDARRRVGSARN